MIMDHDIAMDDCAAPKLREGASSLHKSPTPTKISDCVFRRLALSSPGRPCEIKSKPVSTEIVMVVSENHDPNHRFFLLLCTDSHKISYGTEVNKCVVLSIVL
jgi:hypothetical protein